MLRQIAGDEEQVRRCCPDARAISPIPLIFPLISPVPLIFPLISPIPLIFVRLRYFGGECLRLL